MSLSQVLQSRKLPALFCKYLLIFLAISNIVQTKFTPNSKQYDQNSLKLLETDEDSPELGLDLTWLIDANTSLNVSEVFNSTKYELQSEYALAFAEGMQCDTLFSPDCSICIEDILFEYYEHLGALPIKYMYGSFNDDLYNTTRLVSGLSGTLIDCTNLVQGSVTYLTDYAAQFEGNFFTYMQALFVQGLTLLVELQKIQEQIKADQEDPTLDNQADIWYQYGKITYIFLTAEPPSSNIEGIFAIGRDDVLLSQNQINLRQDALTVIMDFLIGFVETTLIMDPTIFYQCEDTLSDEIIPEVADALEKGAAQDVYGMLIEIWSAFEYVDFMAHTCYGGMVDLVYSYVDYIETEGVTISEILFNILYNFPGLSFDTQQLGLFLINSQYQEPLTWYQAGEILGDMEFNLFTPPEVVNEGGRTLIGIIQGIWGSLSGSQSEE